MDVNEIQITEKKSILEGMIEEPEKKEPVKTDPSRQSSIFDHDMASLFVLVGKSGKGKSHFTKWLLLDRVINAGWKFGLVFTRTKFNNDYDFLPDNRVIEGYRQDILKKFIDNLRHLKETKKEIPPNFIIFEDLVGILSNQTDWFNNWISVFRHTNTNIIINVQYLMGRKSITPIMREQTNFCIMFRSKTKKTLESLYENYGGLFEKFKDFKSHFFNITDEPFVAMLYLESSDEIEENYYAIKAPKDLPNIMLKF